MPFLGTGPGFRTPRRLGLNLKLTAQMSQRKFARKEAAFCTSTATSGKATLPQNLTFHRLLPVGEYPASLLLGDKN